ncbi:GHKL domain-containing protein [Lactobacillus crispatus]|uniref:GHKL domain-containing protein n=1 Tax=Lactobacillus crispatus TaxID=47770 RepID=UPI003D6A989E
MSNLMFEIILQTIFIIISVTFDILIFDRISLSARNKKDKTFLSLFTGFIILISIVSSIFFNSFYLITTICEIVGLYIYFGIVRKKNKKLVLGSAIIFSLVDLIFMVSERLINSLFLLFDSESQIYLWDILIDIVVLLALYRYNERIREFLTDINSSIFLGIIIYLYVSIELVNYYLSSDRRAVEVIQISLGLLVLQTFFAILVYAGMVHIQKDLLTRQEQEQQKLQLKLTETKRENTEIRNRELALKEQQLQIENAQLKEYSNYLDKNEDELRHFKHDYENLLNSLKISAEKGDSESVVKQLAEYTDTQIDEKALRKYKGVNHIHVEELKSIVITKLAKLYNEEIPYSFGCDVEIYNIPKSVSIFDIVRITFDNAIEESQSLIKQTGNTDSAKVDAMYYQEDGNFEFRIRNRIAEDTSLASDILSKDGYSTKKHHTGIGLANIKRIESKYEECMLINYGFEDGWFTFDIEIMPDNEGGIE